MIGTLYEDTFNMTLSIVPSALGELGMPAVDSSTLTAVAGDVSAWWIKAVGAPGPAIISSAKLTSIKLNRIGPNGRYVDATPREHTYPTPIAGPSSDIVPPQLSSVMTLQTRIPRGRASKGRVYMVPSSIWNNSLGNDGRVTAANASSQATGFLALITALNTRYSLIGRVGVASNAGAGAFEHVTRVGVGRVLDTMRSRRSSLDEDHQYVNVP